MKCHLCFCLRCQNVCRIKAGYMFQNVYKILQGHILWDLAPPPSVYKIEKFFSSPSAEQNVPCNNSAASESQLPETTQSCWLFFCVQNEVQPLYPLVEKHVGIGRQDLVQAGLTHRVVRNPKPLRAKGEVRRGRAAAVGDEMSWVHVPMVNQNSCELEEILRRAARNKDI